MWEQIGTVLITIISTLAPAVTAGSWLYRRQNKRLKETEVQLSEVNVEKAKIESKADEWNLWKEQCEELRTECREQREANRELMARNNELVKSNREKEDHYQESVDEIEARFAKQTEVLRAANRDNTELYKRIAMLEREKGELQAALVYAQTWVCKRSDCDHGDPPRERLRGQKFKPIKLCDKQQAE